MRLGVWTPLPHTIPREARMDEAVMEARTEGAGAGLDKAFAFAADVVRLGEANGFDISLVAARHLGPDLDAWTLASALGALTHSMEFMVAVHPGINHPQMVAKMGASLDRITGGRASINVVNGWNQQEFDIFGNGGWVDTPDQRYRRMDEFVQVTKGLWTAEPFSFDGEFFKVAGGALPLKTRRPGGLPIYTASRSEAGKEIIARHCDYWFASDFSDFRRYGECLALLEQEIAGMNERADGYGRKVGYGLSGHVICAATVAEAEQRACALEAHGETARYYRSAARALGACLVGTPALIADRIAAYEERGVELMMLHFSPMLEGLKTFVDQVLPLLENRHGTSRPRSSFSRVSAPMVGSDNYLQKHAQ